MTLDDVRNQFKCKPYIEITCVDNANTNEKRIKYAIDYNSANSVEIEIDFSTFSISYKHTITYTNGMLKIWHSVRPMTCRSLFIPHTKDSFIRYTKQFPVQCISIK